MDFSKSLEEDEDLIDSDDVDHIFSQSANSAIRQQNQQQSQSQQKPISNNLSSSLSSSLQPISSQSMFSQQQKQQPIQIQQLQQQIIIQENKNDSIIKILPEQQQQQLHLQNTSNLINQISINFQSMQQQQQQQQLSQQQQQQQQSEESKEELLQQQQQKQQQSELQQQQQQEKQKEEEQEQQQEEEQEEEEEQEQEEEQEEEEQEEEEQKQQQLEQKQPQQPQQKLQPQQQQQQSQFQPKQLQNQFEPVLPQVQQQQSQPQQQKPQQQQQQEQQNQQQQQGAIINLLDSNEDDIILDNTDLISFENNSYLENEIIKRQQEIKNNQNLYQFAPELIIEQNINNNIINSIHNKNNNNEQELSAETEEMKQNVSTTALSAQILLSSSLHSSTNSNQNNNNLSSSQYQLQQQQQQLQQQQLSSSNDTFIIQNSQIIGQNNNSQSPSSQQQSQLNQQQQQQMNQQKQSQSKNLVNNIHQNIIFEDINDDDELDQDHNNQKQFTSPFSRDIITTIDQKFMENRIILVCEPELITEGYITTYKLYRVKSKIKSSTEYDSEVLRRFSDFEWLYNELVNKYGGYLIPLLPEKNILTKFNIETSDFTKDRQKNLEFFLQKLADHPKFQNVSELKLFMFAQNEVFSLVKGEAESQKTIEQKCSNVIGSVKNYFQSSIVPLFGYSQEKGQEVVREQSEVDKELNNYEAYIQNLSQKMYNFMKVYQKQFKCIEEELKYLQQLNYHYSEYVSSTNDNSYNNSQPQFIHPSQFNQQNQILQDQSYQNNKQQQQKPQDLINQQILYLKEDYVFQWKNQFQPQLEVWYKNCIAAEEALNRRKEIILSIVKDTRRIQELNMHNKKNNNQRDTEMDILYNNLVKNQQKLENINKILVVEIKEFEESQQQAFSEIITSFIDIEKEFHYKQNEIYHGRTPSLL